MIQVLCIDVFMIIQAVIHFYPGSHYLHIYVDRPKYLFDPGQILH